MISRRGLSPVIASIILSGMVLVVGAGVWSYSYGAASTMANDYSDTTIDMVHTISERFCIENVHYNSTTEYVHVWIYNYGDIRIITNTTLRINGSSYYEYDTSIGSGEMATVSIDVSAELGLVSYEEIIVEVFTDKDNAERRAP